MLKLRPAQANDLSHAMIAEWDGWTLYRKDLLSPTTLASLR
jgi:hypothetical protein